MNSPESAGYNPEAERTTRLREVISSKFADQPEDVKSLSLIATEMRENIGFTPGDPLNISRPPEDFEENGGTLIGYYRQKFGETKISIKDGKILKVTTPGSHSYQFSNPMSPNTPGASQETVLAPELVDSLINLVDSAVVTPNVRAS